MSTQPKISVITVCYNSAATITDTLRSVAAQTYPNVEHVIIDGGSKDQTPAIIRAWTQHPIHFISEPDNGIYDAMNKGIALSSGEYIGFLNADDFFADADVLSKIAMRLCEDQLDAVFSALDVVAQDDPQRTLRKYRVSVYSRFWLRIGMMPAHPTFYCRKRCYTQLGSTPYRTDYRIAADFELLVRLLLTQPIAWGFLDITMVKMRVGGVSSQNLQARLLLNREIIRACRENGLYTNALLLLLKMPLRLLEYLHR